MRPVAFCLLEENRLVQDPLVIANAALIHAVGSEGCGARQPAASIAAGRSMRDGRLACAVHGASGESAKTPM